MTRDKVFTWSAEVVLPGVILSIYLECFNLPALAGWQIYILNINGTATLAMAITEIFMQEYFSIILHLGSGRLKPISGLQLL